MIKQCKSGGAVLVGLTGYVLSFSFWRLNRTRMAGLQKHMLERVRRTQKKIKYAVFSSVFFVLHSFQERINMAATRSNILPMTATDCREPGHFRPQKFLVEIKSVFCFGVHTCIVLQNKAQDAVWLQQPPPSWMQRGAKIQIDFDRFGKPQISLVENAAND